jgi:hypothetical protein
MDRFEVRECFIILFEKAHPHEMGVLMNNKEALPLTMWGGNIYRAPQIT